MSDNPLYLVGQFASMINDFGTYTQGQFDAWLSGVNNAISQIQSFYQQMVAASGAESPEAINAKNGLDSIQQTLSAGLSVWGSMGSVTTPVAYNPAYNPPNPEAAPRFGLQPYNYEDYIVDYGAIPISEEEMNRLFIDDIGGLELAQIATMNTISGSNRGYTLISGLERIDIESDPLRLISSQTPANSYFNSLAIEFSEHFKERLDNPALDSDGNLVIELDNWDNTLLLEIEFDSGGTMYEMDEAV